MKSLFSRILFVPFFLSFGAGCLHIAHPVPKCPPEEWRVTDMVPDASKSCIYVFLINGPDPLGYCNLSGVKDYLGKQGFTKTFFGHSHQESYFLQKMRHIHGECRPAHFVIIGFDSGAGAAQSLARSATELGIPVDSLFLLDPRGCCPKQEVDTFRTISVQGGHTWLGRSPYALGEIHKIPTCSKWEIPTHPQTLKLICENLTELALGIPPPPRPQNPTQALVKPHLPPREVQPNPKLTPEEWNFLRFRDLSEGPSSAKFQKNWPETEQLPAPIPKN